MLCRDLWNTLALMCKGSVRRLNRISAMGSSSLSKETWGGRLVQLKTIAGGHDECDLR